MTLDALTRAKLTGEEAFSGTDRIVDDAPVGHSMTVLDFWQFYVVPSEKLPSGKSISLKRVRELSKPTSLKALNRLPFGLVRR